MVTPLAPAPAPRPGAGADPAAPPPSSPRPPLWRTLLHAPVSARAWRDYAYLVVGSIVAAFAFGDPGDAGLAVDRAHPGAGRHPAVRADRARRPRLRRRAPAHGEGAARRTGGDAAPAPPPAGAPRLARRQLRRRRRVAGDRVHPPVDPGDDRGRLRARARVGHLGDVGHVPDLVEPVRPREHRPERGRPPLRAADRRVLLRHVAPGAGAVGGRHRRCCSSSRGSPGCSPPPTACSSGACSVPPARPTASTTSRSPGRRPSTSPQPRCAASSATSTTARRPGWSPSPCTWTWPATGSPTSRPRPTTPALPGAGAGAGRAPRTTPPRSSTPPWSPGRPPVPPSLRGLDPTEPARARELLERAHRDAIDAIAELREVTRSIHPPALDRGLGDALATLAARSGVPTDLEVRIASRPSPGHRDDRLLLRRRAAHERGQARRGEPGRHRGHRRGRHPAGAGHRRRPRRGARRRRTEGSPGWPSASGPSTAT